MEDFTVRIANSICGPVFLSIRFPHQRKITDPHKASRFIPLSERWITWAAIEAYPHDFHNKPLHCEVFSKTEEEWFAIEFITEMDEVQVVGVLIDGLVLSTKSLVHPDTYAFGCIGEVLKLRDIAPQLTDTIQDCVTVHQLNDVLYVKAKVSKRYLILSEGE